MTKFRKKIRVFKTKAFAKSAKKSRLSNQALWRAASDLAEGKGNDLGGNVWKKRLDDNRQRSIVISKVGTVWIFVFLFAKQDMENIDDSQLARLKKLAKDYGKMNRADIDTLVRYKELEEIFSDG
ncbi:hypothetical protein B0G57_106101 [Trinickia symbiotica]|uniref:Addiction module toxin RelE n=1 Tax=Trinickia symbiotica TaxID=863227 RepID=A0A2N7WZX5_9BURK|nr:type II toxin-antitoxin system RelE/ParE family toxin [Trinickia symbiotica]PMS34882.1 addiction module toxin RelE [Trinickia symbiotica]PPK45104.1 hypothetical protein B0G57_106101 [Trinickia symbiotica]